MPFKKKIFIVEDDVAMAKVLNAKLSALGFVITVSGDGAEAIAILKQKTFDLILLDLVLPTKNGFDVLEELQKMKNSTPVTVLTNLSRDNDYVKAVALGATDYFIKADTSVREVAEHVQRVLGILSKGKGRLTVETADSAELRKHTRLAASALKSYFTELEPFKKGLDALHDHVMITDADAHILYVNEAVERETGFTKREALGRNPADLWGGGMPPAFYAEMWRAIKEEKKPFVGEVRNIRKDGSEYWQELHISPILDSDGEARFFIGIEPNISDRKKRADFKEAFVSSLAHQLRDPLSSIRWSIEHLSDSSGLTKKQRSTLSDIYKENQSLMGLVGDLLILARMEVDADAKKEFDLSGVIEEIVAAFHEEYPELDISWRTEKEGATVFGQRGLVKQLFTNMIGNACKYNNHRHGKVEVVLVEQASGSLVVTCKDNGIGIPTADKRHIFQRFFRASNAVENKSSGVGLGLFIAKFIANQHGWVIAFTSTEGKGTIFRIEIPSSTRKG